MTPVSEGKLTRFQRALELLSAERKWLESQPGMEHWEQEAAGLFETMDAWIHKYTPPVLGDSFAPSETQYDGFLRRLWQCWLFHWKERSTKANGGRLDGLALADELDAPDRSLVGDVILAEALVQGHQAALDWLLREDQGRIRAAALRANPRFGGEAWAEVLSKIFPLHGEIRVSGDDTDGLGERARVQRVDQESLLKSYTGQGSLSQYIRRSVIHLANAQARRKHNRGHELDEQALDQSAAGLSTLADDVADREIRQKASASRPDCEQLYYVVLRDALQRLSPSLRVALYYSVLDGKPTESIAAILGIRRENVWRRLRDAKEFLELHLAASPALDAGQRQQFAQCRKSLFVGDDIAPLAEKLAEMLREYPPETQGRGDEP